MGLCGFHEGVWREGGNSTFYQRKKILNIERIVTLKILRELKEQLKGILTKLIWAWRSWSPELAGLAAVGSPRATGAALWFLVWLIPWGVSPWAMGDKAWIIWLALYIGKNKANLPKSLRIIIIIIIWSQWEFFYVHENFRVRLVLYVFGLNSLLKGRSFVFFKLLCSTILCSSSWIQKEQSTVVPIRSSYWGSTGWFFHLIFFFLDQSMSVFNGIAKCFVFTVVEKD